MRFGGLLAALLLAGCTTVSTDMLDDRTAVISGRGSAFNDIGDVTSEMLARAASQAKARGFKYFAVVDSRDATSYGTYTTPTTTNSTAVGSAQCYGATCYGQASGTSTTYGGQSFALEKPGADMMVRFFLAGEVDPATPGVWDADRVLAAHPKKK